MIHVTNDHFLYQLSSHGGVISSLPAGEFVEDEQTKTITEIKKFFVLTQERAFRLPFVSLAIKMGTPYKCLRGLLLLDGWLLNHFSFLRLVAGVRVASFSPKSLA